MQSINIISFPDWTIGGNFDATMNNTVIIGSLACNNVTSTNSSYISCFTPVASVNSVTSYTVKVTDMNGTPKSAYLFNGYTFDPTWPRITQVVPNGGSTLGGASLRINGMWNLILLNSKTPHKSIRPVFE